MTKTKLTIKAAFTLSASLLALSAASPAGAQSWIAFGDSLTDTGNASAFTGGAIPDPTFYKDGRFSNGEIWFDRLAGSHGLLADHLLGTPSKTQPDWNFAVGGATTGNEPLDAVAGTPPGLRAQVALARGLISSGSVRVDRDTTAVLWAGANDHGQWLTSPDRVASGDLAVAALSANNIDAGARAIATSGVGTVAVLNLFDFSLAPTTAFLTSDVRAAGDAMARHHNALLLSNAEGTSADTGTTVLVVDIHGLFSEIATNPKAWGFDSLAPCLPDGGAPTCTAPGSADRRVFWDGTHLTAAAHGLVAQMITGTLAAGTDVPVLSSQTTALAGSLSDRHRRRAREMVRDGSPGVWLDAQSFELGIDGPEGRFTNLSAGWATDHSNTVWGGSVSWITGEAEQDRLSYGANNWSASTFARREFGPVGLLAQGSVSYARLSHTRRTAFAPATNAWGTATVGTLGLEVSADSKFAIGPATLLLDGGVVWARSRRERLREIGVNPMNASLASHEIETASARLDARLAWPVTRGPWTVTPYADLSWQEAFHSRASGGQSRLGSGQRLAPRSASGLVDRKDAELGTAIRWHALTTARLGWVIPVGANNSDDGSLRASISLQF